MSSTAVVSSVQSIAASTIYINLNMQKCYLALGGDDFSLLHVLEDFSLFIPLSGLQVPDGEK